MLPGPTFNLLKPGRLHRGIVIFFLAFTLFDLMFPQFCDEEEAFSSASNAIVKKSQINNVDSARYLGAENSQPTNQSQPTPIADDCCFCCCAHVLPTHIFLVNFFELSVPANNLKNISLPISPPPTTFHPPRFS